MLQGNAATEGEKKSLCVYNNLIMGRTVFPDFHGRCITFSIMVINSTYVFSSSYCKCIPYFKAGVSFTEEVVTASHQKLQI